MEHDGCTPEGKKITVEDWQGILRTMNRYQRSCGYVAHIRISGAFTFFDSEPSYGGLYVTREMVKEYAGITNTTESK